MSDDTSELPKKTDAGKTDNKKDNAEPHKGIQQPKEIGGRDGPDPSRYGDWEKAGRCIDF